jgi:6-phosphogluconolactonase
VPRITLAMPVLRGARQVVFLVAGSGKAEAVERAFSSDTPDPSAPGSMVRPTDGSLILLLDEPAASRLGRRS